MTENPPDEPEGYNAPSTATMAGRQNSLEALRLLIAQRRLYHKAKRWASLRAIGISLIAVAAPLVTVASPDKAVVVGAIAALWVFLARGWFVSREKHYALRGAETQEQFDISVFEMPQLALRNPRLRPEEVSDLAGSDETVMSTARSEELIGWYPFDAELDGSQSVAIAQRANAAYSERLQRANGNVWLAVTVGWSVVAVAVGLILGLKLEQFILGVALPLLPALLDVFDQWRTVMTAGDERRAIADGIENRIRGIGEASLDGQDLLVWQNQMYGLRCSAPQVPTLVYKRARKKNERAMHAAAVDLAAAARARIDQGG